MACLLRTDFEQVFSRRAVHPVFGNAQSLSFIQKEKESYNTNDETLLLIDALGERNWQMLLESSSLLVSDSSSIHHCLWQLRQPVTFDSFNRFFRMDKSLSHQFPVLNVVLENEDSLELVKYISDILAWHKFLFDNVSTNTTREQVRDFHVSFDRGLIPCMFHRRHQLEILTL